MLLLENLTAAAISLTDDHVDMACEPTSTSTFLVNVECLIGVSLTQKLLIQVLPCHAEYFVDLTLQVLVHAHVLSSR